MKTNSTEEVKQNIPKKITKVSLVIYCLVEILSLISLLICSLLIHDNTIIYGYLLCLFSNIFYFFISVFLSSAILMGGSHKKKSVIISSIFFGLKYIVLIATALVGILFDQHFNKWVVLTFTLWPVIFVVIYKIIFANIVSKNKSK